MFVVFVLVWHRLIDILCDVVWEFPCQVAITCIGHRFLVFCDYVRVVMCFLFEGIVDFSNFTVIFKASRKWECFSRN